MYKRFGFARFDQHDVLCAIHAERTDQQVNAIGLQAGLPDQLPSDDPRRHAWYVHGKKVLEKTVLVYSRTCREGCFAGTCQKERRLLQKTFNLVSPTIKLIERPSQYDSMTNAYQHEEYRWAALILREGFLPARETA